MTGSPLIPREIGARRLYRVWYWAYQVGETRKSRSRTLPDGRKFRFPRSRQLLHRARAKTNGLKNLPAYFDRPAQKACRDAGGGLAKAPFYTPMMPRSGRPFTVRMTNLGPLGWVSDRRAIAIKRPIPRRASPGRRSPPWCSTVWREVADYPHARSLPRQSLPRGRQDGPASRRG